MKREELLAHSLTVMDRLKLASLFENGMYKQCRELIAQLGEITTSKSPCANSWTAECNISICEFFIPEMRQGNIIASKDIKHRYSRFAKKFQTLPHSVSTLPTELVITYNCLCMELVAYKSDQDLPSSTEILNATLNRVSMSLCGKGLHESCENKQENAVTNLEQILGLSHFKRLPENEMLRELLDTSLMWCLLLLQHDFIDLAQRCCHLVTDNLHNVHADTDTEILKIPLSPSQDRTKSQILKDLCQLVQATCSIHKLQMQPASDFLSEFTSDTWQPYCVFLKAYSHYQNKDLSACLSVLGSLTTTQVKATRVNLRVKLLNLAALCLSSQGKRESCIEKLKESLQLDFTTLHSLYLVAFEYEHLGQIDAHLESLNLLTLALENMSQQSTKEVKEPPTSHPKTPSYILQDLILACDIRQTTIRFHHSLYLLGKSCLKYNRYEMALKKYKELLDYLKNTTHIITSASDCVTLPSMHQIYSEACLSALRCGRYDDCVTIATEALAQSTTKDDSFNIGDSIMMYGRKRSIYASTQFSHNYNDDVLHWETKTWTYKADSLQNLDKCEQAVTCLSRAIEYLENKFNCQQDGPTVEKMAKTTDDDCTLKDLVHCYSMMGSIQHKLSDNKSTLHYYRLALQIHPENTKAMYNLTAILSQTGRVREAVIGWLQFRGTNHRMDSFQLANEIKRKKQQIQSLREDTAKSRVKVDIHSSYEVNVSEEKLLQMDLTSLNQLLSKPL